MKKVLELDLKQYGKKHPNTKLSVTGMIELYNAMGKPDEAQKVLQQFKQL